MLKIGGTELKNPFLLAPMAGVGDIGLRRLSAKYGAAVTYTEMVSAIGLIKNGKKTERLLITDENETVKAVQLFGSDLEYIAEAARNPLLDKFDIIDINMGCPVQKVIRSGAGAALMKTPELAEKIVSACVKAARKPVTVKFRLGWDGGSMNFAEFGRRMEGAGAAAVTLHARTKEQGYSGKADWSKIYELRNALTVPVIANGDITDCESLSGCRSVSGCGIFMIGRGAYGRPWIFKELNGGGREALSVDKLKEIIFEHFETLLSYSGEAVVVPYMRHHIGKYLKGLEDAAALRAKVNEQKDWAGVRAVLDGLG